MYNQFSLKLCLYQLWGFVGELVAGRRNQSFMLLWGVMKPFVYVWEHDSIPQLQRLLGCTEDIQLNSDQFKRGKQESRVIELVSRDHLSRPLCAPKCNDSDQSDKVGISLSSMFLNHFYCVINLGACYSSNTFITHHSQLSIYPPISQSICFSQW